MAKRRKGEKPVIHEPANWSEDCIIAHMIRRGDTWFSAWFIQTNVRGLYSLGKRLGIARDRLDKFWRGAAAAGDELEALARPFNTDAASLRASIAYAEALKGSADGL